MERLLFIICVLLFGAIIGCVIYFIKNNKKRVMGVILIIFTVVIVILGFGGYYYYKVYEGDKYIRITEDNKSIEIKLKNHQDYYGHSFYSFSSEKEQDEILEELKQNGYDAHYDENTKNIVIKYNNIKFEIKSEGKEKVLFKDRYYYMFINQEK